MHLVCFGLILTIKNRKSNMRKFFLCMLVLTDLLGFLKTNGKQTVKPTISNQHCTKKILLISQRTYIIALWQLATDGIRHSTLIRYISRFFLCLILDYAQVLQLITSLHVFSFLVWRSRFRSLFNINGGN